jgi:hypothetical protein
MKSFRTIIIMGLIILIAWGLILLMTYDLGQEKNIKPVNIYREDK